MLQTGVIETLGLVSIGYMCLIGYMWNIGVLVLWERFLKNY